jgi:LacI family transcriptional regulator
MSSTKARIKDIAHLAGVSIGTVDRVLHDRGEVAESTKERILGLLRETNYSPNLMARVLKSKRSYNIVVMLPEPTMIDSYWQKHPCGIDKALQELDLFPVDLTIVNFSLQSEIDFQNKTRDVLNLEPDGILFSPIFKAESISFCKRLSKDNIPFIFIDGYIEETDFLAYIGEDVYQSGKVAGQLIDMVTGEDEDILVVNIAKNIHNIFHLKQRTQGFLNYFEISGKNKGNKLTISIADPSSEVVRIEMDKVLMKYPGVRSIFISGSKSYFIARYLEEKGLNSINLVGYDLLGMNVDFLKSGITRFLIGQRPEEQAYKGVKKLFEYLSMNKKPEKFEFLPVDIITSENVDFFK